MLEKYITRLYLVAVMVFFSRNISLAQELTASAEEVSAAQDQALSAQEEAPAADKAAIKPQETRSRLIKEIEILTGYGWSRIKGKTDFELKRDYDLYPIYVDFNFNFKDITKKIGFNPPVALLFQLEPYIAAVSSPNANVEIGNSFMFKLGLVPETWKFQPYIKAGAGMVWMSQHTREQSTQFNFIETGVFGAQYYLNDHVSVLVEGRMRHLSNASIKEPNHGINSYFVDAGLSYKY